MQGRVKQLRLLFGLDQAAMAELLGCPPDQVDAWENGAEPLTVRDLERFVERFDVNPDWLSGENAPIWGDRLLRLQRHLSDYVQTLSGIHLIQMITATTGERMAYVLRHMQELEPKLCTVECLACWLGLTPRSTQMLLQEELDPGSPVIGRASELTGVPQTWFRAGPTG